MVNTVNSICSSLSVKHIVNTGTGLELSKNISLCSLFYIAKSRVFFILEGQIYCTVYKCKKDHDTGCI